MDGEENPDEEDNVDQPMADQPQLPLDNVQLGFVEVPDDFSVDPSLANYWARNSFNQNAEAVRLWASHFNSVSSSQPTVIIPSEWSNFFTCLLVSPSHFSWASNFFQSKSWDLFKGKNGNTLFSIPNSCPTSSQLACQKFPLSSIQDRKGKAVIEDITQPSSPMCLKYQTPGE